MTDLDGPRWGPKAGKPAQLVVLCHGLGADGHDLIDLAPHWSGAVPHAAFAAPDAPELCDQSPTGRHSRTRVPLGASAHKMGSMDPDVARVL